MIARRDLPSGLIWKAALAVVGALVLFRGAAMLAGGNVTGGVIIGALAVAPFVFFAMWRYPLIFPFGLLAALVPFDALLQVGGTGANISRFVGYMTLGAFVLYMLRTRAVLRPPTHWYGWLCYVAWAAFTTVWSIDSPLTQSWIPVMSQLLILLTLCAIYPIQSLEIRVLPWIIIGSGLFTAFIEIATGKTAFGARTTLEINGNFLDPNHFSAYFMLPLGLITARFLLDRDGRRRIVWFAMAIAICFAILKCGSRGGFIGVGVLMVYAAIRTRHVFQIGAVLVTGLLASLASPTVWERFNDPTQGNGAGRGGLWSVGIHALPHYWLFGSGFGTFPDVYDHDYFTVFQRISPGWGFPAHNLLVQSSVETGLIGVTTVLVAWFLTIRATRFIQPNHELYWQRIGSECMMVGLFNSALTIDMLWWKYLWVALAFAALVANAARPRFLIAPPGLARRSAVQLGRRVPVRVALRPQPLLQRADQ